MHLNSSHVFSSLSFHTRTLGSNFLRRLFVALNRISITNSLCLQGTQQQTCYTLLLLLIDCTHRQIEEWTDKWPTVTQTLLRILRRQSEQSRYFVNIFKCQTQQYKAIAITNETVQQQIITATIMEKCVKLVGLCA